MADNSDAPVMQNQDVIQALPIGGGLWVPVLHPELRIAPPYTEWTFSGDMVHALGQNSVHPPRLRARDGAK